MSMGGRAAAPAAAAEEAEMYSPESDESLEDRVPKHFNPCLACMNRSSVDIVDISRLLDSKPGRTTSGRAMKSQLSTAIPFGFHVGLRLISPDMLVATTGLKTTSALRPLQTQRGLQYDARLALGTSVLSRTTRIVHHRPQPRGRWGPTPTPIRGPKGLILLIEYAKERIVGGFEGHIGETSVPCLVRPSEHILQTMGSVSTTPSSSSSVQMNLFATTGEDHRVCLWDARRGIIEKNVRMRGLDKKGRGPLSADPLLDVKIKEKGTVLCFANWCNALCAGGVPPYLPARYDLPVTMIDIEVGRIVRTLVHDRSPIYSLAVDDEAQMIFTGSSDNRVRAFDSRNRYSALQIGVKEWPMSLYTLPERHLLLIMAGREVKMVDLRNISDTVRTFRPHGGDALFNDFWGLAQVGMELFVTATERSENFSVWNLQGEVLKTFPNNAETFSLASLGFDESFGTLRRTITQWDLDERLGFLSVDGDRELLGGMIDLVLLGDMQHLAGMCLLKVVV